MESLFDTTDVVTMPADKIKAIVAEDDETCRRRIELQEEKASIQKARAICAKIATRRDLRVRTPGTCHLASTLPIELLTRIFRMTMITATPMVQMKSSGNEQRRLTRTRSGPMECV